MLKIIHHGLDSTLGGIETYLNKIYSYIDRSNFHFDFIGNNNICFYDEFRSMGSNFFKIDSRRESLLKYRKQLNDLFKLNYFDILHCHLNTLSDIDPILAALKSNCKVIVHSRSAGMENSIFTNVLHNINFLRLPRKSITMIAVSNEAV